MKITNHMALPQPFVDAVTPRKPQPNVIRVTELIGPPLIRQLMLKHWDELEDDASARVWSLFGQSVHAVLEAAATEGISLVERELVYTPPFAGPEVRGRPDLLALESGTLVDYKVTSVWSVLLGDRAEWERQLNVYALMLRGEGHDIRGLENVCILRDWSRREAQKNVDYPKSPVHILRHSLWDRETAARYVWDRLILHTASAVPCSPEERWERPTTYAIKAEGRKRAVRVLDSLEAAERFLADNPGLKMPAVEVRPGASVRCQDYCPVRSVCPYRVQFVKEETDDATSDS